MCQARYWDSVINNVILESDKWASCQSLFGMSKLCSISRKNKAAYSTFPEHILKGVNVTLNSFQEKTRAVKAVLYLIDRVEMGADVHLA